ncbi:MAG: hypothetical protein HAW67_04720 [Endozoicomonadaceae bacterium]|nr:hypothetical protein [Endozoicomonadaceae bacterium]
MKGRIGATVILNQLYRGRERFQVVLSNIHIETTREKKSASDSHYTTTTYRHYLWKKKIYADILNIENHTRLVFSFNIPNYLNASSDDYIWEIKINKLSGKQRFYRKFIIPVTSD